MTIKQIEAAVRQRGAYLTCLETRVGRVRVVGIQNSRPKTVKVQSPTRGLLYLKPRDCVAVVEGLGEVDQ